MPSELGTIPPNGPEIASLIYRQRFTLTAVLDENFPFMEGGNYVQPAF